MTNTTDQNLEMKRYGSLVLCMLLNSSYHNVNKLARVNQNMRSVCNLCMCLF